MNPVRLHFDAGAFAPRTWLLGRGGAAGWVGATLLAAALAGLAATAWQFMVTRQELATAKAELQALGRLQPAAAAGTRPAMATDQRRAWNEVVGRLNMPWTAMLDTLEAQTPDDVALVSIEPDARGGIVRVQAEARTLEALLAYARALRTAGPFADAIPMKHETNEQDPNRPVRLTLQIRLREQPAAAAGKQP